MKTSSTKQKSKARQPWVGFAIIVSITFMLALVINLRAYSTMSREAAQHESLNKRIENLTSENLALQDEIHNIRSDARTIEREAKKIGLSRPNE
jgi:cell division protein FtsB